MKHLGEPDERIVQVRFDVEGTGAILSFTLRGYVEVEKFRARTTSRNHTLRLLYFFYALILYNAWLLANLMLAKRFSKLLAEPIIRVTIMKAATRSTILASLMESEG